MLGQASDDFNDNTSFLDNGIVDSTGILEVIGFLEETFGVKINDDEMMPTNLDSVSNISSFLTKKMGTAS
jgi:acyl carrier protein